MCWTAKLRFPGVRRSHGPWLIGCHISGTLLQVKFTMCRVRSSFPVAARRVSCQISSRCQRISNRFGLQRVKRRDDCSSSRFAAGCTAGSPSPRAGCLTRPDVRHHPRLVLRPSPCASRSVPRQVRHVGYMRADGEQPASSPARFRRPIGRSCRLVESSTAPGRRRRGGGARRGEHQRDLNGERVGPLRIRPIYFAIRAKQSTRPTTMACAEALSGLV